ncbi:MAG: quercetin 2,3-dioxygenase [Pseudonocardiales bacterium]|nr:quercetin 2,3-dioxygenase [Pseudonocardiales bacterium]
MSEHAGIRSLHSFSAGAHYDADNVAFGALVGVDEHVLDPGVGFDRHGHRGVAIVTWVVEGALRHEDSTGRVEIVEAGHAAVQVAGRGIEHVEANASATEPVRFVQTTLLSDDDEPSYRVGTLPIVVAASLVDLHRSGPLVLEARRSCVYVVEGEFAVAHGDDQVKRDALYAGDSMRAATETATFDGSGEMLVVLLR